MTYTCQHYNDCETRTPSNCAKCPCRTIDTTIIDSDAEPETNPGQKGGKTMTKTIQMDNDTFQIEVIAKGSYIDNPYGDETEYTVEATTIRLNPEALNAWVRSETMNCRECYDTDQEWEDHKRGYEKKREGVIAQIIEALGFSRRDDFAGSISVSRAQSEVFTVVRIWKNA